MTNSEEIQYDVGHLAKKTILNLLHAAEVGCLDIACQLNEQERTEVLRFVVDWRVDIKIQDEYGGME